MDCSPTGFPVHGILQARIVEWVAMPSPPGDLPNPGIEPVSLESPALAGRVFITNATWEGLCLVLAFLSTFEKSIVKQMESIIVLFHY